MKVSVLTVCWNSAATIERTLDSFFAQSHPDKEMFVIDGASTDGTLEILARYEAPQLRVISEPDRGMYDALNKGLGLYTGDVVGVLNSDDCYAGPGVLAAIVRQLETADAVQGDLDFVTDHVSKTVVRKWRARPRPPKGFATGWMPAHPTFYVRRALATAVGPFDLDYKIAADYDWMMRACDLHGCAVASIDQVMINMMVGGKSTVDWRASIRHNMESLRSRQRHLGAGPLDYALFAKPLGKLSQFFAGSESRSVKA